jgi:spore coat protein CotH
MKKTKPGFLSMALLVLVLMTLSCENPLSNLSEDFGELSFVESMTSWDGYSTVSHSEGADADYDKIFNDSLVQRIDITIDNDYYKLMEEDMTTLYGSFGQAGRMSESDSDPIYVPVTLKFNPADGSDEERTWWHVGMRYKGNSSLRDAWQGGIHKLPFRLNFDEFDYIYSEIEDQRFWGFEKMTFSNGKDDDSLIRDKIASDLYKEAGVEVAEVAFCRIFIDVGDGNGPVYWGLYSMIEDPSDQMLDEQFTDGSGNLYKPDDETNSTLDSFNEAWYEKKTNESEADWSDIKSLISALDKTPSSSDDSSWQATLESVFDVDKFLDYLAINNFSRNWDVYGSKAHNYYLYGDPDDAGRLTWFPWDLNESFTLSTSSFSSQCLSIYDTSSDYNDRDWPLLYYVMNQDTYITSYKAKLATYFNNSDSYFSSDTHSTTSDVGIFNISNTIEDQMQTYSDLIENYVIGADGEIEGYTWLDQDSDFTQGLSDLKTLISSQFSTVSSYLEE